MTHQDQTTAFEAPKHIEGISLHEIVVVLSYRKKLLASWRTDIAHRVELLSAMNVELDRFQISGTNLSEVGTKVYSAVEDQIKENEDLLAKIHVQLNATSAYLVLTEKLVTYVMRPDDMYFDMAALPSTFVDNQTEKSDVLYLKDIKFNLDLFYQIAIQGDFGDDNLPISVQKVHDIAAAFKIGSAKTSPAVRNVGRFDQLDRSVEEPSRRIPELEPDRS